MQSKREETIEETKKLIKQIHKLDFEMCEEHAIPKISYNFQTGELCCQLCSPGAMPIQSLLNKKLNHLASQQQ